MSYRAGYHIGTYRVSSTLVGAAPAPAPTPIEQSPTEPAPIEQLPGEMDGVDGVPTYEPIP